MPNVDLKTAYCVHSKGHEYWYAWRGRGAPRLKAKPGSKEFIAELNAALESHRTGNKTKIHALVTQYKQNESYKDLAASTKRNWDRWLDRIRDEFGKLSIAQFDRVGSLDGRTIKADILKWRDKWRDQPRSADYALQVLSALFSFAVATGKLGQNPCAGISTLYSSDRSALIWTDLDLSKLKDHASVEVYRVAMLGALTGLRLGDLLQLRWDQIDDVAIERPTNKSISKRRKANKPKVAVIPLYDALREFLATCPKTAETVLTTSRGGSWQGWGTKWNEAIKAAGLDAKGLRFHDLRGTAATKFYAAGFSERDIATIIGWSEEEVEKIITKYVNRQRVLREKIDRMNSATSSAA